MPFGGSLAQTPSVNLPQTQGWVSENGDAPKSAGQALYGPFYGLTVRAFDLTPDPKFLFLTARQREALSNLVYGLITPRGFTLLIRDAGTGKNPRRKFLNLPAFS